MDSGVDFEPWYRELLLLPLVAFPVFLEAFEEYDEAGDWFWLVAEPGDLPVAGCVAGWTWLPLALEAVALGALLLPLDCATVGAVYVGDLAMGGMSSLGWLPKVIKLDGPMP